MVRPLIAWFRLSSLGAPRLFWDCELPTWAPLNVPIIAWLAAPALFWLGDDWSWRRGPLSKFWMVLPSIASLRRFCWRIVGIVGRESHPRVQQGQQRQRQRQSSTTTLLLLKGSGKFPTTPFNVIMGNAKADLKFVKKFTRPNFRAKEFYRLKMRKSTLFLSAINSKNVSLSVIWPFFG